MFHNNLKAQRLKKSLSQKQVADFLCVSPQSVSKWEKGESLPSVDFLPKLAECLGCDINCFFANEDNTFKHFDVLNSFFALMVNVLNTDANAEDVYAFISENPNAVEIGITFCRNLLQYKTVNLRSIRKVLNCSDTEANVFIDHLQRCEMLEALGIQDSYFVMKEATEGMILLIKIQDKTCEIMRKTYE